MQEYNNETEDLQLPEELYILPIHTSPIFPGLFTHIMISAGESVDIIRKATKAGGFLGINFTLLPPQQEDKQESPIKNALEKSGMISRIGTVARIIKQIKLPDGGVHIFLSTLRRFITKEFIFEEGGIFRARYEILNDITRPDREFKALVRMMTEELKKLGKNDPNLNEELRLNLANIDNPGKIADFIASNLINITGQEQQEILETLDVADRIEKVIVHIRNEQEIIGYQKQIQNRVNSKIEQNQREYFLREELKVIQRELGGENNPREKLLEKLRTKLDENYPYFNEETKESVTFEYQKLQGIDMASPEFNITYSYLELIANLPYKDGDPIKINIEKARKVLDRDHYGLEDVKDRILEFLAVKKLKNNFTGSILCLVGPPGVGKTSVGISIAHTLGKPIYRFSVGGMTDESEIKGHRRTYVGALPGKIIQGLKITKTNSPVFLIDEIDKIGNSYKGDPASALLEVLDPEQNMNFRDRYLDLPFDLSKIIFICTANSLDTIPSPLLDRMEVISLSGYTSNEKVAIGRKYLLPKSLKENGLEKTDVKYSPSMLSFIANCYAREAGVRNFEKALNKLNRKIALQLVTGKITEKPVKITKDVIQEFLGQPIFSEDEYVKADMVGTSLGLAWTSMGGDVLLIESQALHGKGALKLTGQLGDVMQESANIAYSYIKGNCEKYRIDPRWFETHDIHLHVPEGAVPKDGPSAGITMACCIYSLITKQVITPSLAMTGELTLKGKVMPIGGLKEKTLAAGRNKTRTLLIPYNNQKDLQKLSDDVKSGHEFHAVSNIDEVFAYAFPNDANRPDIVCPKEEDREEEKK